MNFIGKDQTGQTLRTSPEALEMLRAIAPLPDLNEVRLVIEPAPPKNRVLKIPEAA
jgi:hypothetical protein